MKRTIKYALALCAICVMLSGCRLHEDKWDEYIPLPEIDIEVDPDPWEPGDTDETPIGE